MPTSPSPEITDSTTKLLVLHLQIILVGEITLHLRRGLHLWEGLHL